MKGIKFSFRLSDLFFGGSTLRKILLLICRMICQALKIHQNASQHISDLKFFCTCRLLSTPDHCLSGQYLKVSYYLLRLYRTEMLNGTVILKLNEFIYYYTVSFLGTKSLTRQRLRESHIRIIKSYQSYEAPCLRLKIQKPCFRR